MRKAQKSYFALPAADLAAIVEQSTGEWSELRGARLFITGGTGFFGKWLLGALARADAELALNLRATVLSRDPTRFLEHYPEAGQTPVLRFMAGNVADFSAASERNDFIIHAAADTLAVDTPAQEEERSRNMVEGARRMIALARSTGARRLLNISSGAVYGASAARLAGAREEDYADARPVTPYARAKRDAEDLCAASGLDVVTARAFAFLGPHLALDAHYAAGNFLRDAARGGTIRVKGDGTALRSYLYPSDLVVWLLRILLHGQAGRAYNVGSDETVSTADLARRIAAACEPTPTVEIQSALPHGPQNIYLPNVTRAQTELGLKVTVPLDDAIGRTLAWVREAPSSG